MSETQASGAGFRVMYDNLLREHEDCKSLLTSIERFIDSSGDRGRPWVDTLIEFVSSLRGRLAAHFEEEAGEFLGGPFALAFPQYSRRVAALAREHETLIAQLNAILGRAEDVCDQPDANTCRQIEGRLRTFIFELRLHESEENRIILNAYWSEDGTSD